MGNNILHITNGSSLTDYLRELDIQGDILTWHEMLCEGPTTRQIDSPEFMSIRKEFLNSEYNIEIDEIAFKNEIELLNNTEKYSQIILWFEYDLFCHVNMLAVINLLNQKQIDLPVYLVCSGRVKDAKDLKGLSELTPEQLLDHYKNKIFLTKSDLELAYDIWDIYCGKDHNLLKPFIVKSSSFIYLSSCLKAHLKRFPDSKNGLNTLENNILEIVKNNTIKSKHHLLGYTLNYQGYYGFGDLQIERIIDKLSIFFDIENEDVKLNRKGHEALLNHANFIKEINNNISFGGVNRLDFQFSKHHNKLIKSNANAN